MLRLSILAGALAAFLTSCADETDETGGFAASECEVGIYGTAEEFVAVTRYDDGFSYSFSDGRRGRIGSDGEVACGAGAVRIGGSEVWDARPLAITDVRFEVEGAELTGQLIEPADASEATPLVVLAHGSEEWGWVEASAYPYQFVGRGVSVFVYDKRGTGRSGGTYSQNFPQLADDLVAASAKAKELAAGRYGTFGLFGFSQGGWIAPLAADRSGAEFIGIGYGLVVDILEEDASQVALELREAGYGDEVIAEAREITDVTARLAVSGYTDGLEELDALKERYGDEEWYGQVRGGFTGVVLSIPTEELRSNGIPMFDRLNIDWSIRPMDVLREVDVPQLWVLAEKDREAPIATTLDRLQTLRGEGKDITVYVFPDTDHGMTEFEQAEDGSRRSTKVAEGYHDLLADWAKGSLTPPYAASTER